MTIDEINLFYDVKSLFNMKDEAFEVYNIIKSRVDKGITNKILLVFPTIESKRRNKIIIKNRTQLTEQKQDELTDGKNIFIFTTLYGLFKSKYLDGFRYKEVRFLG